MRNRLVLFFLTLVLTAPAFASGNQDFEPSLVDVNPARKEKTESKSLPENESLSPTDVGVPDRRLQHELALQAHETWIQATNLVVGGTTGVFDKNDKKFQYSYTVGVQRTLYSNHDTASEFGVEFNRLGLLGIDWGYKWLMSSADNNEPFYKLGIAAYYDPADHLANFVDYQRYLIRGSVGFENVFRSFRRLKVEAGAGLGPVGVTVFANMIYAFPD